MARSCRRIPRRSSLRRSRLHRRATSCRLHLHRPATSFHLRLRRRSHERTEDTEAPIAKRRKLLAASLGLATLSLVGCGSVTSGNLLAPPPEDAGTDAPSPADANEDAPEDR